MYILTALLICKMCLSSGTSQILPRSPCPNFFHYEWTGRSPGTNDMPFKGVITVTSTLPVSLKVKLQIPAALYKEYNGRLEVAERKLEPAQKINSGSFEKVRYNLYYPKNIPIPKIILIQLNNKVLCSTNPIPSPVKTIVVWEHTLRMGKTNNYKHGKKLDDPEIEVVHLPESGEKDIKQPQIPQETCGKPIRAVPLIVGGAEARRGDWPWTVPIFRRTELGLRFICASTLISDQFVVTAAHCLEDHKDRLLDKNDVIAYPGKFNIRNWVEDGIQPREISEIHVHPDYEPLTAYSDLALLRLKKPLKISRFANPACLWDEEVDLDVVVGKRGIISGWGTYGSGSRFKDKANLAIMPIVSQEECLRSNPELLFYTSERTFCAGNRNDSGPCNGDSGAGLMLPWNDRNGVNRWYLRGILSLSLVAENHRPVGCNVDEYVVFTDIAKYKTWISDLLKSATFVY